MARRRAAVLIVAAACLALACAFAAPAGAYTRVVYQAGTSGSGQGSSQFPGGVAVSADGSRVYVADTGNDRINEFEADGHYLRAWGFGVLDGRNRLETCTSECVGGQFGPEPGELNEPSAIAVAPDGTVYVLNHAKFDGRVQAFDPRGPEVAYVETLPAGYGASGPGEASFTYPLPYSNDIAVGGDGRVYVGDNTESGARLVVFAPGSPGSEEIRLAAPEHMIAFSLGADRRIWATGGSGSIALLEPDGALIREFRTPFLELGSLTVEPGSTETVLAEEASRFWNAGEAAFAEFDEEGKKVGEFTAANLASTLDQPSSYGVAINPGFRFENEFEPEEKNEQGVIYITDRYGGSLDLVAEESPGQPVLEGPGYGESGFVNGVDSGGVTLSAKVDPKGFDTHVQFVYGTTTSYGSVVPALPGIDIGNGFVGQRVSARLSGLQPNTTYHYATVATNSAGTRVSADGTFTTFPVAGPFSLPDGRAYELATPDTETVNVNGIFAAPGGDGILLEAHFAALPGSESGGVSSTYAGLRGADVWRREAASVPVLKEVASSNTIISSPDLSQTVGYSARPLVQNAPAGENLYLRDNATGAETLMTPEKPDDAEFSASAYGASADFRRIFFRSFTRFTPDTPEAFAENLFEFSDGTLKNIGILPGASSPSANVAGTSAPYPVSEDGSKVFFGAEPEGGGASQAFARIDGNRTIEISAAAPGVVDPEAAGQSATFVGATPDGSVAFFTSSARLTADAFTGSNGETGKAEDRAPNLYRYELGSGTLTDLTVATDEENAELGAAVTGSVVVAEAGESAYLVAKGVLAPGASAGKPNLYRWQQGAGFRFVATVNESDQLNESGYGFSAARTTADGSVLAFTSSTALDPAFPDVEGFSNATFRPLTEIYRWSVAEGKVVCVSCTRSGTGQLPEARIDGRPSVSVGYGGNVLGADGRRLVFQTRAALVPEDTNGANDVYEWEDGSAHLISNGSGSGGSLVDASRSGDDVFFSTGEALVPGDEGDYSDVYDAKVGGGFPVPSPVVPCEGDACRSAAPVPPPAGSLGSGSLNGPGNKKARHHRQKHKKKHHGHKKHRRHGKHKRSHVHPSVGKRG